MLRAIHLFPEFSNIQSINALRAKYDPLVNLIPPHVTLVFPFESDVTAKALRDHLEKLAARLHPFNVTFSGVTGAEGEYLYLNVKTGNDEIIRLHDQIYKGLLKEFLNRSITYIPHLTVGRMKDKKAFKLALSDTERFNEVFKTTVREIVVETIDQHAIATVEIKVPLSQDHHDHELKRPTF